MRRNRFASVLVLRGETLLALWLTRTLKFMSCKGHGAAITSIVPFCRGGGGYYGGSFKASDDPCKHQGSQ
jgi:hypothetical protein